MRPWQWFVSCLVLHGLLELPENSGDFVAVTATVDGFGLVMVRSKQLYTLIRLHSTFFQSPVNGKAYLLSLVSMDIPLCGLKA